ncbi:MAG TPA: histidine kinase [Methylorubrum populi]|uniref:Histidine kinase n=1 Tax=Methylorubrum populi TaxID=223967 RepID=A0A921E3J6_9HYPH|nr:histidine kinase [Methylorubrum populi]
MHKHTLSGKTILIVEDDYFIAEDLVKNLETFGARVAGPAPTISAAAEFLREASPTAAILDVKLSDGHSLSIAENLTATGIPFIFYSGYDEELYLENHQNIRWILKPSSISNVLRELETAIRNAASQMDSYFPYHENRAG